MPRKQLIQVRRDTAINWATVNPVLADGEHGFEKDTNQIKVGDGNTLWNDLRYIGGDKVGVANVKDFGAKGDGIADDTAAIQAALNSGKRAYLPEGNYRTTAPLYMDQGSSLYGASQAKTSITKSTTTAGTGSNVSRNGTVTDSYAKNAIIIIRHPNNSYAYKCSIKSISLRGSGYTVQYGVYAPRTALLAIEDVEILRCRYGFVTHDTWMSSMHSVVINADTQRGLNGNNYGWDVETRGFDWLDDGSGGATGTSISFINCWARDARVGYHLYGLQYSSLTSCGSDNISSRPYWFHLSKLSLNGCATENVLLEKAAYWLEGGYYVLNSCQAQSLKGHPTDNTSSVLYLSGSTVTLNNCVFDAITTPGITLNMIIQTGAKLIANNTVLPSGGNSFISFNNSSSMTYTSGGVMYYRDASGTKYPVVTANGLLTKANVGLSNVDDTSDLDKPISTATQTALNLKANDADVVKLTGNQTIAGDKTFSGTTFSQSTRPTADGTGALGNTVAYYLSVYARRHFFNATAVLDGSVAGSVNLTGNLGIGATGGAATHAITLGSTSANSGVVLYGTSTQTTDYERGYIRWDANALKLGTEFGGTGVGRDIILDNNSTSLTIRYGQSPSGSVQINRGSSVASSVQTFLTGVLTQSSGNGTVLKIAPNITQTGTASYTGLHVDINATSVGSGTSYYALFQTGGDTKAYVRSDGRIAVVGQDFVALGGSFRVTSDTGGFVNDNNNSSFMRPQAAGVLLGRNIADTAAAVRLLQQNVGSTGDIAQFQFGTTPTTVAKVDYLGNFEITTATAGVILKAPGGARWRVTIDDAGELVRTAL